MKKLLIGALVYVAGCCVVETTKDVIERIEAKRRKKILDNLMQRFEAFEAGFELGQQIKKTKKKSTKKVDSEKVKP